MSEPTSDLALGILRTVSDWREVPANHMPCDLCDEPPVGWVRVSHWDRCMGGRHTPTVFMVCADHIRIGEPVLPGADSRERF